MSFVLRTFMVVSGVVVRVSVMHPVLGVIMRLVLGVALGHCPGRRLIGR